MPEIIASREEQVGLVPVRRALPTRGRRTVGAWCFADHMGPASVTEEHSVDIGPHPHCGLQTVTWLVAGEILHRDSVGSEQPIRPGQLNLMTAGHGVSHSEEATGRYRGDLHGIQLWVAQPEATRHGAAAFEHHDELPATSIGSVEASVLVGTFAGTTSPARADTDHLGVELRLPVGAAVLPVDTAHEHAFVVLAGSLLVDGEPLRPGAVALLEPGRDELPIDALEPTTVMLLGGTPFPDRLAMRWNWVARTKEELDDAEAAWRSSLAGGGDGRFGSVASPLARIPFP
jgi:redox-sensitive bicupin YhaK (pirin superfamily)